MQFGQFSHSNRQANHPIEQGDSSRRAKNFSFPLLRNTVREPEENVAVSKINSTVSKQTGQNPPIVNRKNEFMNSTSDDLFADELLTTHKNIDPHEVWQVALSQLEVSVPASTFNTWVRDTHVWAYEDGEFIIAVPNSYACDWLQNRLRPMIKRMLTKIVGQQIQVSFRVCPRPVTDSPNRRQAPLYDLPIIQAEIEDAPAGEGRGQRLTSANFGISNDTATENIVRYPDEQSGHYPAPPSLEYPSDQRLVAPIKASTNMATTGMTPINLAPINIGSISVASTNVSRQEYTHTGLNPHCTFETFVVGSHNRLASAAAQSITDRPGRMFNPLFVYGGVGLGKTHLLHSIGNSLHQRGFKTLYCTTEHFTNELISAIRSQSTEQFRNKYRAVDVMLIDDIQFLSGKESTQEEFFHTFNHIQSVGGQIVISSDRLPKAVPTLADRLRSRFEGGLQVDISQPDFETRVAILASKAAERQLHFDLDILKEIAARVESNVRELEGALNQLALKMELVNGSITPSAVRSMLDSLAPPRTPCTPEKVISVVAQHYQQKVEDLIGARRTKDLANARHIAMYLLRTINALSLPAIGQLFSGRDHTTVSHGIEKIEHHLEKNEALRLDLVALREKVYAP